MPGGGGNGTTFILQLGQCEVPQGETDLPCPALAHNHLSFLARPPVMRTLVLGDRCSWSDPNPFNEAEVSPLFPFPSLGTAICP